jgi:hypothetical protein
MKNVRVNIFNYLFADFLTLLAVTHHNFDRVADIVDILVLFAELNFTDVLQLAGLLTHFTRNC